MVQTISQQYLKLTCYSVFYWKPIIFLVTLTVLHDPQQQQEIKFSI